MIFWFVILVNSFIVVVIFATNRAKYFKNGPSKIRGRQPLKNLMCCGLFKALCYLQLLNNMEYVRIKLNHLK